MPNCWDINSYDKKEETKLRENLKNTLKITSHQQIIYILSPNFVLSLLYAQTMVFLSQGLKPDDL